MTYINETGLPSVTEIIRPYIGTEWFRPEHRDRGNAVHGAIAAHLQGLWVRPLEPEHQPYFDSFCKWEEEMVASVALVEERLVDRDMGFCGKLDAVLLLKGDKEELSLVDWKTSQASAKWWGIQNAAYRHLSKKDRGILTHRGMSLRLKRSGSGAFPVDEYSPDYSADFNIFIGLLNAHKRLKQS